MRKELLIIALGFTAVAGPAAADDLSVPGTDTAPAATAEPAAPADGKTAAPAPSESAPEATEPEATEPAPTDTQASAAPVAPARLPSKGISMAEVEKQFGTPRAKQPTVGGDSPKHPPITRWDYDGFVVIFEKDRVVDAVVPGAPPRVFHKERLTPTPGAASPAPAASPEAPAASPEAPATPAAAPEAPAGEPAPPAESPSGSADADSAANLAGTAPASPEATPSEAPADPANVATPENPNPDAPPPAP